MSVGLVIEHREVEPWSVGEYARRLIDRRHPVHYHDGFWWMAVRPRFCWALDPLEILPAGVAPSWFKSCVGYQYRVAEPSQSTGFLNPMLLNNVPGYGLERLGSFRRNRIRKGLKSVLTRVLNDPEPLKSFGWEVENEFFQRTRWRQPPPKDRWPAEVDWSFREPVIDHKLGAFAGDRLVGYMTWFGLGRTAHLAHIAASNEGTKACANDALLHSWVMLLRESGLYDRAVYTVRSFKPSLDEFKESHGFHMESFSALIHINPLLRLWLRRSKSRFLDRLYGLDENRARAWIASTRTPDAGPHDRRTGEPPGADDA